MRNVISSLFQPPSQREMQVLSLIADEYTTKEIANHLFLSHETVTSHRQNLMSKLKARNTAGLIRRAFENRILSID